MKGFWGKLTQAYIIIGLCADSCLAATVTVTSDSFPLSIKHDGIRASDGEETLTYSSRWDGGDGATVTIAQDGVTIAEGLTSEGACAWSVPHNGTYVLTHTTYTNGVAGKVESATFVVTGKDVPFAAADVTVSGYEGKYDGVAHGIAVQSAIEGFTVRYGRTPNVELTSTPPTLVDAGALTVWCEIAAPGYITQTNSATVTILPRPVTLTSGSARKVYDGTRLIAHEVAVGGEGFVEGEGATFDVTGSQTAVGTSANTFAYSLNDGTKAGNYEIATAYGTLEVTKATVGPGDDEEPGGGEVPEGGLSAFDATAMYDGEGHTLDTNALAAAFGAAMVGAGETRIFYGRAAAGAAATGQGLDANTGSDAGQGLGAGEAAATEQGEGVGLAAATGAEEAIDWREVAPAFTNAGEYAVWYKVTNPNYEDFVHEAKVTITKRPVTVTVVGRTAAFTYDTTAKRVAGYDLATADALYDVGADTAFGGAAEAVRTDAGTTAMGLSAADFANGNANFDVAYRVTDGWVKVEPRVIGDDPANWDIRLGRATRYDGAEHEAPIIQVCYVKPDGNLDNIPYTLSGHTATDAGNYTVRIAGAGNYAGAVEKEWSITPRSVTLASGSAAWTYDGAAHRETSVAVGGDGFADGEGATYSGFPTVTHVADAATPQANTFAYALNANTKARNYEIATAHGTVQMAPRALTLTAPTKTKTYDGAPLTFGADEVAVGGDGYAAGEAFALGGFASITEAGRVDAAFTVSDGTARRDDYVITTVFGTLTVARNATEIAVTAKSGSWVYDGEAHALHDYEATNLGALLAGDALAVAFDEASAVATPVDGPNGDGVVANVLAGVRVMRGDRDVTRNYTLVAYPGTLRVTRRPVTLTSKSDTKAYDGTPLVAHEVTVGGDGFVGSDGATYAFTGAQTEKGTSKNAFTYALKGGTDAAFYEIATAEGDLAVTAADISAGAEDDWNIVLGPALVYTGLEQVQTLASVTYRGLALDCSVSGNQRTDAGAYRMTLTGQGNFTGERTVGWTIAPKPLTLTAGGGSRTYDGTAFRVGAVTAAGFVAGEGAAYVCDGAQTDVGSSGNAVATILWNAGTKASNYAVTKEPGTLTVTPRPVTLTAANLAKPYDGTPLALTAADIAAEGLVAGESFVYSDFASRTEAGRTPATFAYAAGAGTKLANYAVAVTPGRTLTVTRSATAISVTAASGSWVYDGAPHSNRTWTATNLSTLQPGDALEVTFDAASVVTTPQDGPNGDGVVANVLTGVRVLRNGADDVTANYTVEGFPGTLAVTKRPVTVAVTGHTATFTYDGAEKRVAGYDLATADALYDPGADTAFGGAAEAVRTDAGTTAMGLSAADFANGNANFDVTYQVTDGGVTIAPLDIAAVEDGAFVLELGANPKYNGTVQTVPVARVTCSGLDVAYTLAGENATHAGTYVLTVKGTGNFAGERSTTWRMLPRRVTLTSGSARKVYDGTALVNAQVAVSGDGFIGLEGAAFDVTGAQTSAGTSKNTFTYALKAGTQAGDYEIEAVEGDLTVTKATYPGQEPGGAGIAWSVAADAATWVYDGRAHGVALTGVPAGVTARLAGNAATDAGDYVATAALDYDAANYEPPAAPAPLAWSITPRPVTLMAASKEKPYDGFPLAVRPGDITASGRGYAPGECFDYFDFASLTDVGEIPATFGYRDSATAKVSNYAVTVVGGQTLKVTVGGDQISVTADSGTWAYDGAEHRAETWSVHNGDKLLEGHALQVAIDPSGVVRTPKDGPDGDGVVSNRFASVRVVETATGADRTRNYNLVLCEGVLRVTNACIRAEWLSGTADVAKTYDGAATQAVVTAALLQPATVRYAVGAALPADGWAAEPPSFVHAGTQTVWYAVSADCYEPYTNSLRVAVAPRPVTLATPTKSKTYDGSPLTFGADEVAVGGDGYAPGESFVLSGFASLSDAGRIAARCAYAAGAGTRLADYAVAEDWGTLTVLASADEITVTAADGSWPYDGTAHALHAYAAENADTLRPGDELVVAFAPESVVLTPEDGPNGDGVVSNVIASVRVVRNGSEDVTRNYSLAWYPGTLRVTKARIAFDREGSVDPSAFSTSATYDGAGHAAAVVPPALLTDPVTVRYGASADAVALDASPAFTNAGIHTVFYTLDAPYYETYAGTATVTIAPRPVTLVSAGAEKVYDGTPLRADAVRVKEGSPGFVGDEGFAASCRGALTDVGAMENLFDYALTGGALAGNYAVSKEYGWLRVTPATLDPGAVFGGGETDAEGRLVCARVYNGAPQPFAPAVDFGEPYRLLYAPVAGDEGAYAEAAPTRTHVAEGDLVVFFKFTSPNYAPYYGTGVLRITPKTLTEEMVVADEDAAWFFDGTEKKPSVTVVDGSPNIAAADDWTVAYSDRTGAGLFPVTVTGRNDYCGTVTKEFAILKRPVAPPVIPSRTYSGRLQRPSVPEDARWTVVANPGGTDAGDYTNVVLRLASPADYRWKGLGEDETDWTGVFTVRRGANGWSVYPLIRSWTNGVDAASAPAGRPRFGTLSVAYRRRGTPVATESPERPSAPGRYTARFWAEETANYAGVALAAPYEVDFEIYPGPDDPPAGDATATTPVPVPHAWLDAYVARFGAGDYEAAANAVGANGVALWESYVAGLDPADAASRFTAAITVDADGVAHVTWSPDLSSAESPRAYTVYGKAGLGDAEWTPVTDANRARMRFFRVQVELK